MRHLLTGLFLCGFVTATFADDREDRYRFYLTCQEKGGPTIGMTEAQVESSCWGKPQRVHDARNGTIGWTYPQGFLFFTDGKLSKIARWLREER